MRTLRDCRRQLRVCEAHNYGVRAPQHTLRGVAVVREERDGGGAKVAPDPHRRLHIFRPEFRDGDRVPGCGLLEAAEAVSV